MRKIDLKRTVTLVRSAPKRGRGRPPKPIPKLNASPEKIARSVFSAVKPPDPGLCNTKVSSRAKK